MKKYMESFYEESNMVHTGICGGSKLNIIISHSDLDGVTSAINLMMASKLLEEDFVVFLERTSRHEETTRILNEWLSFAKENPHKFFDYSEIEVMISDRMFIELDKVTPLDNMKFSWYDHHQGNVVPEEDIRESLVDKLKDYKIYTDIAWCGATISCYNDYQALCNNAYNKASENALRFNEETVILEAEWKYASMIKEKWCEEHPSDKMVITHHKSGGTVYTTPDYETPSFEIAGFIGTSYKNNGGGHKHAAGFGCLDLAVAEYLDENEMRAVVKDRIYRALKAFFNKGGN